MPVKLDLETSREGRPQCPSQKLSKIPHGFFFFRPLAWALPDDLVRQVCSLSLSSFRSALTFAALSHDHQPEPPASE